MESTHRVDYIERGNTSRKGEVQVQVQVQRERATTGTGFKDTSHNHQCNATLERQYRYTLMREWKIDLP